MSVPMYKYLILQKKIKKESYINIFVGPVAQWKRIRLRIWGLQVRSLPGSPFYKKEEEEIINE